MLSYSSRVGALVQNLISDEGDRRLVGLDFKRAVDKKRNPLSLAQPCALIASCRLQPATMQVGRHRAVQRSEQDAQVFHSLRVTTPLCLYEALENCV